MFLPHPRVKVSIVGSLRDREVACSASDRQGSNFESCVWRTVSSQSSHHPQEVLPAQFSLYVHKGGLKPDSFHFLFPDTETPGRINLKQADFVQDIFEIFFTACWRQAVLGAGPDTMAHFYRLGLVTWMFQVRLPIEPDICHRGWEYTVLQTVQRAVVYSAA